MHKPSSIRPAALTEHRLVTDTDTDRHRPMASTADAWHRAVKTVKSPYLCKILTDFHVIWHSDAFWHPAPDVQFKFVIFDNLIWQSYVARDDTTCWQSFRPDINTAQCVTQW